MYVCHVSIALKEKIMVGIARGVGNSAWVIRVEGDAHGTFTCVLHISTCFCWHLYFIFGVAVNRSNSP